ncbi:MAG: YCF48-related protein [Pseudomonadota bacterium]
MRLLLIIAMLLSPIVPVGASDGHEAKGIFGELKERQFGRWTLRNDGIEGGTVSTLAVRPGSSDVVFGASRLGVFRSDDGGVTWAPSRTGLELQTGGQGLAFDPQDPDRMYIGTLRGPFASRDGGTTWLPINEQLRAEVVNVAVDPTDPDHLLASVGFRPPNYFESFDRGETWQQISLGVDDSRGGTRFIFFHPTDPMILFAGVQSFGQGYQGLLRSIDGGATWLDAGTELGGAPALDLVFDPGDPDRLFLAANCAGVFLSENGGDTWAPLPTAGCQGSIDIDPLDPLRLVASSQVSLDGGASWSSSTPGGRSAERVAAVPGGTVLLAGIRDGAVYRSVDDGTTWIRSADGFAGGGNVTDIAFRSSDEAYAVASRSGIFRTTDRGLNWERQESPDREERSFSAIAFSAADPLIGYAGSDDGVMRTGDGGGTWSMVNNGMAAQNVVALAIDPTDAQRVFAATSNNATADLWRSVDGGATWERTDVPRVTNGFQVTAVVIDPSAPNTVYVGIEDDDDDGNITEPKQMVYKSVDGGDSWNATDPAIDVGQGITALTIDPEDPRRLYAGTFDNGLFRTLDGGDAWVRVPELGDSLQVASIAIDPADPNRLFARRFLSVDRGDSWVELRPDTNFPGGRRTVFVPDAGEVIFNVSTTGVYERRLLESRLDFEALGLNRDDRFGEQVVIEGSLIAVGLPGSDEFGPDAGAVALFEREDDGGLVEVQRLGVPPGFTAFNFGSAIDVEGDFLIVGAPRRDGNILPKGASLLQAAIFERLQQGWTFKAPVASPGGDDDEFGAALALDGEPVLIGAPGDDGDAGAAYVFEFEAGVVGAGQRVDPAAP